MKLACLAYKILAMCTHSDVRLPFLPCLPAACEVWVWVFDFPTMQNWHGSCTLHIAALKEWNSKWIFDKCLNSFSSFRKCLKFRYFSWAINIWMCKFSSAGDWLSVFSKVYHSNCVSNLYFCVTVIMISSTIFGCVRIICKLLKYITFQRNLLTFFQSNERGSPYISDHRKQCWRNCLQEHTFRHVGHRRPGVTSSLVELVLCQHRCMFASYFFFHHKNSNHVHCISHWCLK